MTDFLELRARAEVDRTLKGAGFRQAGMEQGAPTYEGIVRSGRRDVAIHLLIDDFLFTRAPRVRISDNAIEAEIGAHISEGREFCYITRALEEYDPYNPGGAILRCLESVRETLNLVLHGNPQADLQREFLSYWNADNYCYLDLPADFEGKASVYDRKDSAGGGRLITTPKQAARWGPKLTAEEPSPAMVITAARPLVCARGRKPGETLESFGNWISQFLSAADTERVLAPVAIDNSLLLIRATNGSVVTRFHWPTAQAKAFRKAPAARRHSWIDGHRRQMKLERSVPLQISRTAMVNARLNSPSPLEQLSIAVVGCGAVGSRIILDLVRSGAGSPGHTLFLVDPDTVQPVNLGRHVLGVDALNLPKVDAMAAEARRFHPELEIQPIKLSVLDCIRRLEPCDLIIDATGHNPLALRLNELAVERRRSGKRFPPILHVAVHGNGLAAQTILVDDLQHACFKCMRPGHGTFRANPIKPGIDIHMNPEACGDGAHIPYAASAPATAAALAVQAVLEWAEDCQNPGPRVRTRCLNIEDTVAIRDRSWGRDADCPACNRADVDA